ncbi:MAG: hypothetical protein V1744_05375 [Candidatus Altiarchaeota archaeon]
MMERRLIKGAAYVMLSLCLVGVVSAYYTMDVTSPAEVTVSGGGATVELTLKNRGDEPSYSTVLELMLPEGFTANRINVGKLPENTPYTGRFNITVGNITPGSYAIPVYLRFQDRNRYQISMVYPLVAYVKNEERPMVDLSIKPVELDVDEEILMEVQVRNRDTVDHTVNLKDAFPDVLLLKDLPDSVDVPAKSVATVNPTVTTFGALPDSSFTVLLLASYVKDGIHYESLSSGRVKTKKRQMGESSQKNPLLAVAALVGVFLLAQYAWKHRKDIMKVASKKRRK